MLGYSDSELAALGGYDLVHYDDLSYISSAHQERKKIFKTFIFKSLIISFSLSFKNRSIGNDCLPISEERRRVAMASNQLKISL